MAIQIKNYIEQPLIGTVTSTGVKRKAVDQLNTENKIPKTKLKNPCSCGATTHQRSTHRDCPNRKKPSFKSITMNRMILKLN